MEKCDLTPDDAQVDELTELIGRLRGEGGCPWDRRQTARSMAVYLVEEVFELAEAIESEDARAICEEAGDVLFQLLFIVALFREKGRFGLADVVAAVKQKMIRRHPHVFGDSRADDAEAVRRQWHRIKQDEKGSAAAGSVLDSVPAGLPALMRAYRISERAARTGFDWPDMEGVMAKTVEEWEEFRSEWAAVGAGRQDRRRSMEKELGDILFTLTNVARFAGTHPESALTTATQAFEKRFRHMEEAFRRQGRKIDAVTVEDMARAWEAAKTAVG